MSILAVSVSLGVGKALNNTNTKLPGYLGSAHISARWNDSPYSLVAGYTRIGASYVASNTAISTLGVSRHLGRYSLGINVNTGTSYSAAVWWDKNNPLQACGVEGCGKEYVNDGTHFSRACHLCGGTIAISVKATKRLSLYVEYVGIRHMSPTFQGLLFQVQYTVNGK